MGRGKPGGALSGLHPADLLAQVLTALVERTGIDPGTVEDVMIGCVGQAGEQSATPGRQAWLSAGFPVHVPSVTIERKCGSGQQAVEFAAHGIIAGAYDIVIAGGVESMSRVPMGSARMGADPGVPVSPNGSRVSSRRESPRSSSPTSGASPAPSSTSTRRVPRLGRPQSRGRAGSTTSSRR
jgi:acetyl-CoA acetyltransferase